MTLLHLLDLPVFQLQRGLAAEDGGHDADHPLVRDDLVDLALEVLERAVGDLDLVPLLELRRPGPLCCSRRVGRKIAWLRSLRPGRSGRPGPRPGAAHPPVLNGPNFRTWISSISQLNTMSMTNRNPAIRNMNAITTLVDPSSSL